MALTLVESAKLTNDELQIGVVELLIKDNPVLNRLPFVEVLGNGLTYNVETTQPNVQFYDVNEEIEESSGTRTSSTAVLKRLGGFIDVDNFEATVVAKDQSLEAIEIASKVKALEWQFMNQFFYGSSSNKGFDGLHTLIASTTYNTVHAGAGTGSALSIDKLRSAIDLVKGTKPDMILMSKPMRRGITKYLDSVGSAFPVERDKFGIFCRMFDEIPIYACDFILDTETAGSGAYALPTTGANTSIFILSFNPAPKACQGLQAGGGVQTLPWGNSPKKDAKRWLIKWYASVMLQSIVTCAKVDGIVSAGTVTA